MQGAEIDRWSGCCRIAPAGLCVAQATCITAPATAAQNEPEELVEISLADCLQRLPLSGTSKRKSHAMSRRADLQTSIKQGDRHA
jgi:hypothetical protein